MVQSTRKMIELSSPVDRSRSLSGSRSGPSAETQEGEFTDSQVDPSAETQLIEEAEIAESQVNPEAETQVMDTDNRSRSRSGSRSRSSKSRSRSR